MEFSIPVPTKPTGTPGHGHGAGLTKGHLDQMLGKKKNHYSTAAASSSNMDRGQNAKFLHTCPSEGNGHLKSQTSSTFIALQWSGAANSVHRQGNNGAPLLDLSVSPAFDPQHISA